MSHQVDLTQIRPYGDTMNDGKVQVSFTLPLPAGARANAAALRLAEKMGLNDVHVVYSHDLGVEYTFFVVYGAVSHSVDVSRLRYHEVETPEMEFDDVNDFIRRKVGRQIVVVGATTGSDAHTVGLDSIMNMKGFNGDPGLERYPMLSAHNLGAQVENERLLARALDLGADAILVSQVVTQKEAHLKNLTEFVDLVEAENLRDQLLLLVGGPRITHALAKEVGFDAGFGPGTAPHQVAAYIATEMAARHQAAGHGLPGTHEPEAERPPGQACEGGVPGGRRYSKREG
ncbi:MAG: OAM dimerization domain-containing protein [Candidatus Eremiobacterota bacterium]